MEYFNYKISFRCIEGGRKNKINRGIIDSSFVFVSERKLKDLK